MDAFENDCACDWQGDLIDGGPAMLRAHIEQAFDGGMDDARSGEQALAAAETVARVFGRPGQDDAYTEDLDAALVAWDARLPPSVVDRALEAVEHATGPQSEVADLWAGDPEWTASTADLTSRLQAIRNALHEDPSADTLRPRSGESAARGRGSTPVDDRDDLPDTESAHATSLVQISDVSMSSDADFPGPTDRAGLLRRTLESSGVIAAEVERRGGLGLVVLLCLHPAPRELTIQINWGGSLPFAAVSVQSAHVLRVEGDRVAIYGDESGAGVPTLVAAIERVVAGGDAE